MIYDILSFIKLLFSKDRELLFFCKRNLGFYPRDVQLFKLALVHRSTPIKTKKGRWGNNERLEFLGDAIIEAIVSDYLFKKFPNQREGFLTNTRSKLVQRENLNKVGEKLGLGEMIQWSHNSRSHNSYLCGNAVEALVGAIYLDRGYHFADKFVQKHIIGNKIHVNRLARTVKNFKSQIIEWAQKYKVNIDYKLIETTYDSNNNPTFRTQIFLGGIGIAEASGFSKKESHQKASKLAYEIMHNNWQLRCQVLQTSIIDEVALRAKNEIDTPPERRERKKKTNRKKSNND